jgi:ferredoxin
MIFVDSNTCDGCGDCIEVCPTDAISLQHSLAFIDQEVCQGCAACTDACPQGAILNEETMPVRPEIVDLAPVDDTAMPVLRDQSRSLSWRDALVSTLVWTGREMAPRLANLVVSYLENRMQTTQTNPYPQHIQVKGQRYRHQKGKGRQRRQRRRQRKFQ